MHADQQYIDALRQHNSQRIEEIYRNFAPGIKSFLLSKGAGIEEAGDIFQEAIIDVYKLAQNKSFTLTCPLEAFLLLICKRKWINQVEKNRRQGVTKPVDDGYTQIASKDDEAAAFYADTLEKEEIVIAMLQQISDRCREIIMNSYADKSQQQLADKLGISYAYLRKKKSLCMAELISLVRNNKNHAA
ncbi:RNA polymerase sigma factor [Niabella sp. CJ426]|uniref:RNA polymerase sigma factor n=1 Tax=Niabella sp. CJ426 TaxID=3393740 RepID=UPI003D01E653